MPLSEDDVLHVEKIVRDENANRQISANEVEQMKKFLAETTQLTVTTIFNAMMKERENAMLIKTGILVSVLGVIISAIAIVVSK